MAEEAAPSTEQAQTPAAPQEQPSPLEKVYTDFKIEDQAASFQPQQQAQPVQQQAPVVPKAPDPFDPNFQQYVGGLAQSTALLNSSLHQTQAQLTAMQQQIARERVEADISKAVGKITEKAGIEPEIAEVALEAKARQDQRFRSVWENRHKNPKAFEAAINAVAMEFQQKFTVRQDTQLVENQRAVKASQQQMATTTKTDKNDEWASMSRQERDVAWRRLVSGG